MTINPLSPNTIPPGEQTQADQTDRLITQRQQGVTTTNPLETEANEANLVDALVQMAADTAPSPAFVTALEERLQKQRPLVRKHFFFPIRRFAVAVSLLLALGCGLLLSPAARATLWDWLYGFGLIGEEQVAELAIPLVEPVMPATTPPPPLTLSAIQAAAPFTFYPPTWLPAGLRFTDGFVMPGDDGTIITLAYHLTDPPVGGYPLDAPLLFIVISDGPIPNRPLVAEGDQMIVRIGNHSGVYTHGNWRDSGATTDAPSATATLVWDNTLDAAWLTWQADGLNYLLYAQGLQLDAEDLAVAAVSMR